MQYYSNLSQITDKYDILLVDLWGVIHDGITAYPGVASALGALKAANKTVIFISNAPRRSSMAIEGLGRVGVADDLYDNVITSGEIVFEFLKSNPTAMPGNRCCIIGPSRDAGLLDGLNYVIVTNPNEADFLVVTGFDNDDSTLQEKQPLLEQAIKLNLPLICANPDLVVVRQNGTRALCAGVIAEEYLRMGGQVRQFGKPYQAIYERALQIAGNPGKKRIAAIGDSLITDIKGANDFGIDSYLIPGGIFGAELGIVHGQMPEKHKLQKLCDSYEIVPVGILPEFIF